MSENNDNKSINIAHLFDTDDCEIQLSGQGFERLKKESIAYQAIIDKFHPENAKCLFFQTHKGENRVVKFFLESPYAMESCLSGGWILRSKNITYPSYWVPVQPRATQTDQYGRILAEYNAKIIDLEISIEKISISYFIENNFNLNIVLWQFTEDFAPCLSSPLVIENQGFYLWGSHTSYRRPADLYIHLIHGCVYENNYAWPHHRKICSENDAHAIYVLLSGLERATNSRIYKLLKRQIILSVISRQSENGAWLHGEWTDHMEAHFRLNASAIHLLMDAWEENNDPLIKSAIIKAVGFISQQRDTLDSGVWFLHDDLELSVEKMNEAPFRWLQSKALGKSIPNMLVLNTHLDVTILLDRYSHLFGDEQYKELIILAVSSTKTVLALRPADTLYKIVFYLVNLSLLPTKKAAALPIYMRALKRIGWKYVIPHLHYLKVKYPRFIMPGGYIDRAIPLKSWAFHYLTINIMDLLRHKRRFEGVYQDQIIDDAMAYTYHSGVLEKWEELEYEKYALGFWAESLYHQCTIDPKYIYRKWLAEIMLVLEKKEMGIPPSFLGSNSEAVSFSLQTPCPLPNNRNIRIANLSRENIIEYVIINSSNQDIDISNIQFKNNIKISWRNHCDEAICNDLRTIPAFSWIHGTNSNS